MTLPAFQFLPGPRVEYYQQEEQFWHQRDTKLRGLACTDCKPLHSSVEHQPSLTVKNDGRSEAIPGNIEDQSGDKESPTSVLADYRVTDPVLMNTLASADVQDRRSIKQQLEVQKRLLELAELQEDVLQQLQSLEAAKMQMAEQKLAEQTRLAADLDVRLQAACTTLDCSAGSLHSLQADINRLSTKLRQSTTSSKGLVTDESWKQLSAQCDRLMRNRVTLRNSQPLPSAWGWMGEEPPGTTVGNLNERIAALEDALDAEKREKAALAEELLQKAVQLKELRAASSISPEASDISDQLKSAQNCFESAMLGSHGAHATGSGVQKKTHRSQQPGISIDALSMLREAVNLTPDPKPSASPYSQAAVSLTHVHGSDSDSEEQALQPSAQARQFSSQQCVAGLGSCRAAQQGQEGDRGALVLREAYRGMLLQQQARQRAELDKRQAKYQRQLDAQTQAHEEAMSGLIKGGYIKTCTAGDLKLSGPLTGQVKMLLEENAALQVGLILGTKKEKRKGEKEEGEKKEEKEEKEEEGKPHPKGGGIWRKNNEKPHIVPGCPGNIHALKDDITNRVEYALWQQRQAHEASLAEIYQQHAQELQAVGPASQQVHEEDVKTLINEAVQAEEAEHAADLMQLQQGFQAQLQECKADLKDRDRQYSALLRELKALKRHYRSTDASSVSSEEPHNFNRLRLDKLLGPCMDDSPPCQGSPPSRPSNRHHPSRQSHYRRSAPYSPASVGSHMQHRRITRGHAPADAEVAAMGSVESPLTSMVNAVLGNRERGALAPVQPSPQKPAQLPELLPGHASPDTAHVPVPRHASNHRQQQLRTAEACTASSTPQLNCTHQQACGDEPGLHAEPTISYRQDRQLASVAVAACCLRCGVDQSKKMSDCTFHPALLPDPGPFLYGPEWHACRAARHGRGDPGCYVRQGHYFPGHAVQSTGLLNATINGTRWSSPTDSQMQPQPRTQLPIPQCRP